MDELNNPYLCTVRIKLQHLSNSANVAEPVINGWGAAWHRGVSYSHDIANKLMGVAAAAFLCRLIYTYPTMDSSSIIMLTGLFGVSRLIPVIGGTVSVAMYAAENIIQKLGQAGSSFMNTVSA